VPPASAPDEVALEDVAVMVAEAVQLFGTLEAMNAHQEADHEPLPRGMLTCGQACRMVAAVIRLGLMQEPRLLEDDVLEQAIRAAAACSATGAPN
jgi:hypothetical protein